MTWRPYAGCRTTRLKCSKRRPESRKDIVFVGKAAHDGSDRIVYDDKTGKLFYDADGNGGDAAVLFAKLDPHLDLGFGDFLIV